MYISLALIFLFFAAGLKVWRSKKIFDRTNKNGIENHEVYKEKLYTDFFDSALKYTSYLCVGISFTLSMIALPRVFGL